MLAPRRTPFLFSLTSTADYTTTVTLTSLLYCFLYYNNNPPRLLPGSYHILCYKGTNPPLPLDFHHLQQHRTPSSLRVPPLPLLQQQRQPPFALRLPPSTTIPTSLFSPTSTTSSTRFTPTSLFPPTSTNYNTTNLPLPSNFHHFLYHINTHFISPLDFPCE